MNLNDALQILERYGITTKLESYEVYTEINKIGDPLSEPEHIILFETFWYLGNKKRGSNVSLSESLKMKIIRNRHNISRYDMAANGHFEGSNIPDIIRRCHLNNSEEAEFWNIFHKLWHHDSARDCEEINSALGTYKIIESKLKWIGKINVLDIGCGKNGNGIATLTARYNGKINGYGIDLDIQDHPSNVKLIKASVDHLPFADNFFHVIYSSNVIYYFKDKRLVNIIREILRVLKPKGMFVFDKTWKGFEDYRNNVVPLTGIKARVLNYKAILTIKY